MRIPSGKTDQVIYFVAVDATDLKTRETALSSFTVYRSRNGGIATVYTTPTITELSSANMPGVYSLLIDEDTTIAAGSDSEEYCVHITQAAMAPVTRTIELYRRSMTTGNTLSVSAAGRALSDLDTIKTQAVTCSGGVTVPAATLASTTNITSASGVTVNGLAANVITAGSINASALNGKGDWNIGKTGYSLTQAFPTNFASLSITAGGLVDITQAAADKVWGSTTRTLSSFGTLVSDIWANGTRTLTGFSTALAVSVWDVLESAIATASSIGLKAKTNLDAAISTRSTYAGADTSGTTTLLSRVVGTIASGTHNAQSGDAFARLGAPAGASVSADIAAVKIDTADILTDTGTTLDGNITAIKAKTDSLTFTVPNQVDSNIQYVNDVAVAGDGQSGTEWGPA